MRLRLLTGLALLLTIGLIASAVSSTLLLKDFLRERDEVTLKAAADGLRDVISGGPQTVNVNHLGALLGPPHGIVAVDADDRILTATGGASSAAATLVAATSGMPPGEVVTYDKPDGLRNFKATRVLSPG
ncbi:hypothetical protein [Actinomadura madurae]|uniref:hypothetical protein n=1 Tax=Actinomadura madurae TaxID=1993 RepID=UPI0009440BFD|nr:hypothetical protein [Actinomadura madurae]